MTQLKHPFSIAAAAAECLVSLQQLRLCCQPAERSSPDLQASACLTAQARHLLVR